MIQLPLDRIEEIKALVGDKRVGLITNPTGVNKDLVSTIDILHKETNLVALFSPEHGVRGDLQAGEKLDDYIDPDTGCMVYSLYGQHKKPSPEMMAAIDVLVFDIQDVGVRFYTYLYTMAYAMMACQEQGKPMIVLDRPNPIDANTVEGTILDTTYCSFVGYYPIPQRYGLTIGELALLFNTEFDIQCDLTVLPLQGYKRSMTYRDTGLPWVFHSPNIPTEDTPYYYLATCYFEGTNISEGRGTATPFKVFGSPFLDSIQLIQQLQTHQLPGVLFRPVYFTPTFSKHQGELCKGVELFITDKARFEPVKTGYTILTEIKKHPAFHFLPPYKEGLNQMIDLLTGSNWIRTDAKSLPEMVDQIKQDSEAFAVLKRRYQIYGD